MSKFDAARPPSVLAAATNGLPVAQLAGLSRQVRQGAQDQTYRRLLFHVLVVVHFTHRGCCVLRNRWFKYYRTRRYCLVIHIRTMHCFYDLINAFYFLLKALLSTHTCMDYIQMKIVVVFLILKYYLLTCKRKH